MDYTKGKWRYEEDDDSYQDKNRDTGTYKGVITGGVVELVLCVMIGDCLENEVESNANLIAAAPNLYEALKSWDKLRAMRPLDSGADIDDILRECSRITDEALSKAEGK